MDLVYFYALVAPGMPIRIGLRGKLVEKLRMATLTHDILGPGKMFAALGCEAGCHCHYRAPIKAKKPEAE